MLPAGPKQPSFMQALRYTLSYERYVPQQHERHGPSFTLRLPGLAPAVVTSDRELIRHVLTGDPLTRRHANDILAPALGTRSVILLEPEPHLERRRLLLPSFHGDRVRGYGELMRRLVSEELDRWPDGGVVRVHERARALTLSVIQNAVLGSHDDGFARELARLLDVFASPFANFGLFAPALSRRARWNVPAEYFHRERDRLDALMDGQVRAARADPRLAERDDVLALLVQARDEDGRGLSDADLNDELKTLLIAGHETTATAIGWAADLLAHRPEAQEQIRAGDRAFVAAAAKEVMRMRTVVPISFARTLLEPTVVAGHQLPAGTVVLADAYTLHREASLHPRPEEFSPQRFLNGGPPPYSYLPFGGGAHRCLGASLATLELEIALEAITARFSLEPVGAPERSARRGVTLIPAGGASVRVRRRS